MKLQVRSSRIKKDSFASCYLELQYSILGLSEDTPNIAVQHSVKISLEYFDLGSSGKVTLLVAAQNSTQKQMEEPFKGVEKKRSVNLSLTIQNSWFTFLALNHVHHDQYTSWIAFTSQFNIPQFQSFSFVHFSLSLLILHNMVCFWPHHQNYLLGNLDLNLTKHFDLSKIKLNFMRITTLKILI